MLLDTSVLIDLLLSEKGSERFERVYERITDEPVSISMIQLAEISDWCLMNGVEPAAALSRLKEVVDILPLNERILLRGSRFKYDMRTMGVKKFGLIDGIILASAEEFDEKLLTRDLDFRMADNAIVLE